MCFRPITPVFLALATAAIAGCSSPSPRLMGGERQEAAIAGATFVVYRKGDEVEVYRTNAEFMPHLSEVFAKAEQAIRQTTGCEVEDGSLVGDAALMRATLDCG